MQSNWKFIKKNDVNYFIRNNITEYLGDDSFLVGPTEATKILNEKFNRLLDIEAMKNGVIDMETKKASTILTYPPVYLDKNLEKVVGYQTDKILKRAFFPFGGINIAVKAANEYGYHIDDETIKLFNEIRKTHNQGVYDVYNDAIRTVRKSLVLTGLPDGYGRGRLIGDYRRIPLFGVDCLIEEKLADKEALTFPFDDEKIRLSEEIVEQVRSLKDLKLMANAHGFDISKPATNAKEAVQWLYFGYLGAVKEQNGAAMSLGRVSSFLDIYIERDLMTGVITETEAQELIDHLILKLRAVRFARTPDYNALFSGDPTWVTESIGGMRANSNKSLVTKTSFRFLHSLNNLGKAPEPNLTILWSSRLPENFKKYCAKVAIETSSIQFESDELMSKYYGDDYSVACCVSPVSTGESMQYFGARANLAKILLYALNGGKDEITGVQVAPKFSSYPEKTLDFQEVWERFLKMMDWVCEVYVNTLNIIHYMHDKYDYERLQMALHNTHLKRVFATGIAGLSVVVDSLSAIKYAKVKPIFDSRGIIADFETTGEFPCFGNNDDRVDQIAVKVIEEFSKRLKQQKTYRNSSVTLSVLTITSNIVYGKLTGNTPDGRRKGEPFAPGANPMHGRDKEGALSALLSVAKLPFEDAMDGISNTFTIVPEGLGPKNDQINNLVSLIDGYFANKGHHLNVNVLNKEKLIDAMENPELYPNLTIRVSGYAVNFHKLTKQQQLDVIKRTFHEHT